MPKSKYREKKNNRNEQQKWKYKKQSGEEVKCGDISYSSRCQCDYKPQTGRAKGARGWDRNIIIKIITYRTSSRNEKMKKMKNRSISIHEFSSCITLAFLVYEGHNDRQKCRNHAGFLWLCIKSEDDSRMVEVSLQKENTVFQSMDLFQPLRLVLAVTKLWTEEIFAWLRLLYYSLCPP